ncbi:hypothetical protein [Nocardia sp. NPDC048505]|uniref:hypothetical protein n=1 Tax=unclassified Nocardia TaxID=2637762 RepID=UPI00340EBC0F
MKSGNTSAAPIPLAALRSLSAARNWIGRLAGIDMTGYALADRLVWIQGAVVAVTRLAGITLAVGATCAALLGCTADTDEPSKLEPGDCVTRGSSFEPGSMTPVSCDSPEAGRFVTATRPVEDAGKTCPGAYLVGYLTNGDNIACLQLYNQWTVDLYWPSGVPKPSRIPANS